jgi:hypothetical protein
VATKEAASVPVAEPGPPLPLEQEPPGFAAGKLLVGEPRPRVPALEDCGDPLADRRRGRVPGLSLEPRHR